MSRNTFTRILTFISHTPIKVFENKYISVWPEYIFHLKTYPALCLSKKHYHFLFCLSITCGQFVLVDKFTRASFCHSRSGSLFPIHRAIYKMDSSNKKAVVRGYTRVQLKPLHSNPKRYLILPSLK